MTAAGWLGTLTAEVRELVFVVMREIDNKCQAHYEKARELFPRYGENGEVAAWGNEHERAFSRGYALECFVMGLNRGMDPSTALEAAKKDTRACVDKNNKRYGKADFNFAQWGGTADAELDEMYRRVRRAAGL